MKREITITSKEGGLLGRFIVGLGEYAIGSDSDSNIIVESDLVSPNHAVLGMDYHAVTIRDLGSTNGTYINGSRVEGTTRLWPNQKIRIGGINIEVRRIESANLAQPSSAEARYRDFASAVQEKPKPRVEPLKTNNPAPRGQVFEFHLRKSSNTANNRLGKGAVPDIQEDTLSSRVTKPL